MSRRNPMNERYGKFTSPSGKTRKSAASAKPKRSVGGNATAPAKKPASSASKKGRIVVHPDTVEYRRWRTAWWVLLGGAIVLSTLAWLLWQNPDRRAFGNWVLGAGYAMIFGAIIIDWTKLRPLRLDWAAKHDGSKAAKKNAEKTDES